MLFFQYNNIEHTISIFLARQKQNKKANRQSLRIMQQKLMFEQMQRIGCAQNEMK